MSNRKPALVVAITVVIGLLVLTHTGGINGPSYWFWPWRRLPNQIYLLMAAASLPCFAGLLVDHYFRRARTLAVLLLMLGSLLMRLASVYLVTDPPSFDTIPSTVQDRFVTSYYTDAQALISFPTRQWLSLYPMYMQDLNLHSKTKAPGPILYWVALISLWGASASTAMRGGVLLGAIATLAIPVTYWMLKRLTFDTRDEAGKVAFNGAAFLSMTPGFVLFFPMFDPTYAIFSALMVAAWAGAIRGGRNRQAIVLGIMFASTCVVAFHVMVIGIFAVGLVLIDPHESVRIRVSRAGRQAAVAIAVAIVLLILLNIISGYNPLSTFAAGMQNQRVLEATYAGDRRWPKTIFFDLTDFALGGGWISLLLTAFSLLAPSARRSLVILSIVQFLAVAGLGLLPTETARVWNFMLPLLVVPVGIELGNWTLGSRLCVFAALLLLTTAVAQNMRFIN